MKIQGRAAAPGPKVQKERGEERAQAGVCPSLGQAGTPALGEGKLPPIPSSTLKEAFLGSITSKWDCNSDWEDIPEVPHEVARPQPSGRAYSWDSQTAQGAVPGQGKGCACEIFTGMAKTGERG